MFTKNWKFVVALVAVAVLAQSALAGFVTYTETFPNDVNPFPGSTYYPEWSVLRTPSDSTGSKVDAEVLHESGTQSTGKNVTWSVTAPAAFGAGYSNFGTDVTVSSDLGLIDADIIGNEEMGLRLGNVCFQYATGYALSAGHGLGRYRQITTDPATSILINPVSLSYIPVLGSLRDHMTVHAVKNGDNWDFTVSLTETSTGGSFTDVTRTFSDTIVTGGTGVIDKVGLRSNEAAGRFDHSFDNFQVTINQIPEPGTLALLGTGVLGLLARRRRRV